MSFEPSSHAKTCPEFRQQANAENGGKVQDSSFPCNCKTLDLEKMAREFVAREIEVNANAIDVEDVIQLMMLFARSVQKASEGKWISVKERLPEWSEQVLTLCHGQRMVLFLTTSNEWHDGVKCYGYGHPHHKVSVTHWQPLPPKPEAE